MDDDLSFAPPLDDALNFPPALDDVLKSILGTVNRDIILKYKGLDTEADFETKLKDLANPAPVRDQPSRGKKSVGCSGKITRRARKNANARETLLLGYLEKLVKAPQPVNGIPDGIDPKNLEAKVAFNTKTKIFIFCNLIA